MKRWMRLCAYEDERIEKKVNEKNERVGRFQVEQKKKEKKWRPHCCCPPLLSEWVGFNASFSKKKKKDLCGEREGFPYLTRKPDKVSLTLFFGVFIFLLVLIWWKQKEKDIEQFFFLLHYIMLFKENPRVAPMPQLERNGASSSPELAPLALPAHAFAKATRVSEESQSENPSFPASSSRGM